MRALFAVVALCVLCLAACPREIQPPPPGDAIPCEDLSDCNAGRTCGVLVVCVGGFCGEEASHVVPCPGEGTPVP